jgi:hypothetical protein
MPKHFGMLLFGLALVVIGIGGGVWILANNQWPMSLLGGVWIACGVAALVSAFNLWGSSY